MYIYFANIKQRIIIAQLRAFNSKVITILFLFKPAECSVHRQDFKPPPKQTHRHLSSFLMYKPGGELCTSHIRRWCCWVGPTNQLGLVVKSAKPSFNDIQSHHNPASAQHPIELAKNIIHPSIHPPVIVLDAAVRFPKSNTQTSHNIIAIMNSCN